MEELVKTLQAHIDVSENKDVALEEVKNAVIYVLSTNNIEPTAFINDYVFANSLLEAENNTIA